MAYYSLVGKDGNAYNIIGYVSSCMRKEDMECDIDAYIEDAESGDYDHLLQVSQGMILELNEAREEREGSL